MFIVLNGLMSLMYLVIVAFRFYIIFRGDLTSAGAIVATQEELDALADPATLPVYTLLCPLYREAQTVGQFLQAMANLDYPLDKLDIRILLEEDDVDTQEAAEVARMRLSHPESIQVIVLPNAQPRTKPKACNYGLRGARGEYAVIYDAEDMPEPDQLKLALAAFRRLPPETVCVQAKLNYFNPRQNLLTRFFTAEYSMWFDLFLPGLSAVDSPIPLGGTSNHFKMVALRSLGGWDAFNVAEDADLGTRIARQGYTTAIIDSTTWEEANSRVGNWIRQRSRWVKGYMQVWLVAMRHPFRLLRALGPWRFFCFQVTVGGTPAVLLLNPVYWLLTSAYLATSWGLVPRLFPQPVLAMSMITALIGNLIFVYLLMFGLLRRREYEIVPLMFLSPVYWVLQSIAAWKGLYQLIVKPHFWEKTIHSLGEAQPQGSTEEMGV
jgi:cellulose synthase/poly-beta-1,6-N-acetylglucosamine synthase-like glycosyltransferase